MQTGTRNHVEMSKAIAAQGGRECNAQDMTFGGRCLNCGFGEETMQTKTTHTPWHVAGDKEAITWYVKHPTAQWSDVAVTDRLHQVIATVHNIDGNQEANAALIAAAPALLEALEAMLSCCTDDTCPDAIRAEVAVKQARGAE